MKLITITGGDEMKTTTTMKYREMKALPKWTRAIWKGQHVINEADPYKWSGDQAPPSVGDVVTTRMNSLGDGTVVQYFAEHGWLGVMLRLHNPPDWYVKQNGRRCLAHIFGAELAQEAK